MGQHIKYFHLRDVCLWMVERINIPIPLPKAIVKIKHSFQQGRGDLFDAARDVFLPELGGDIYARHLLPMPGNGCQAFITAGKRLYSLCARGDIGKVYELGDPNKCLQLVFWSPNKVLNETDKYVLLAIDCFSRWPSAIMCNNKSDKALKLI